MQVYDAVRARRYRIFENQSAGQRKSERLARCKAQRAEVIQYYFGHPGITLQQLGERFGFSRQRAHQIVELHKILRGA
jgi:DNA-directed RNA polymerase sigma subunit (sigma70/sigma32)